MPKPTSSIRDRFRLRRTTAIGPRRIATSFRRDPVLWLILCGCMLVAAIVVGTAVMVAEFRERALSNAERELQNTVLLLTRHFDQQLEDSDFTAHDLISKMQLSEMASPETFRSRMGTFDAHEMLKSKVSVHSYTGDVNIFDSDGQLINSSGSWPLPAINIADRPHFNRLKFDPQSAAVLTHPIRSYFDGALTTVIAYRLSGPDGAFLGVMARRIDPAHFEKFFASLTLGEGAAISMFHSGGTMVARYPHANALIGQKFKSARLLNKVVAEGGHQTMRVESPIDGQYRLGSAAALSRFPIVVVATKTVSSALTDWREQTRFLVATAVLSAALIAGILFLIVRQMTRQNRAAQLDLKLQTHRLDTALNNMTQGLVLYDASARIVLCNQRYIDMHALSAQIVKPGCHFHDLIRHRKETGSFDGDVDEFCWRIRRHIAEGRTAQTMLELADGRSFHIVNKPLEEGGGWVATIEDITERRRLEQERDRNYAFLHQIIDHIPSQITVKDGRDRRYLLVNRVAEEQFGMPREAIIGQTASELFPKAEADLIAGHDDTALRSADGLFLAEHAWQSQAMGSRYITSRRIGIPDQTGEPRYIINVVDDVTERRRADERISHLAHYDALTDLPNRVLFREQIEHELQRVGGQQFALLYIDIDEFKGINDTLGHHVGDELLKTLAGRIRDCIGKNDLVARLGGDEFAVIRTAVGGVEDVVEFVTRIHQAIRQPCQCLGHQLSTDASIGIALAPRDGRDLDQLIKNADLAMYGAKADGRRTSRFFEPAMEASAKARLLLEQDLRQTLASGGFEIHYQPLVDLRSGEVTGCEALLRWHHPERGTVPPDQFIPVAEDTGLIVELGEWMLRTACAEAANWPPHVRLAVNVSPVQLKCQTLALKITGALAAAGLAPNRLELEITEAVLIRDDEAALAILHQLRAIGVRIALDDFGTGYSSLSYLKRFPFDKIKIDRCFVHDVAEIDGSSAIVQAVVNIAAARHMTTTAEGVETAAQREMLRSLGCTEMQGHLFSAARPGPQVRRLLSGPAKTAAALA